MSDWSDDSEDEEEPQFELHELVDDAWSLAAKAEANDPDPPPAPPPPVGAAPAAATVEKFDARRSLEFTNDLRKAEEFWEANRAQYPRYRDVVSRIDWHAAQLLEDWIREEQDRVRDEALARIRSAPRHPGRRLDGEIVRQIVILKPTALSLRQRQVYHLCFERDLSVHQCAKALGIGAETVRTHLRRLRKHRPAAWESPKSA